MIEVFGQLVELKAFGDPVHAPGFGFWLKGAQQDLSRVFLVIGAFVGNPKDRHLGQTADAFGHDIEVLAGLQRHIDARHLANLMAPHARAVHDHVAGDVPVAAIFTLPVDTGGTTTGLGNARNLDALLDPGAALTRTLGQGQRDVCRVTLAIEWQPDPGFDIVDIDMFVFRLDLGG